MATAARVQHLGTAPPHQRRYGARRNLRRQRAAIGVTVAPPTGGGIATGSSFTLSWAPVPGATLYKVARASSAAGPFTLLAATTDTTYTDATVPPGSSYFYSVTAVTDTGDVPVPPELPAVGNFDPPVGQVIGATTPVSFDVTSGVPLLEVIIHSVNADGSRTVVFAGGSFRPGFAPASSSVQVAGGFRYTILPSLGKWTSTPQLSVYAIDTQGNEAP